MAGTVTAFRLPQAQLPTEESVFGDLGGRKLLL